MTVLIVVDMQNDFMPGGALGVPGADEIIPLINRLMDRFSLVLVTQDWHPHHHMSFASQHSEKRPGDVILVRGIRQILWTDHCIQGSPGAELVKELRKDKIGGFFHKGVDPWIDSYSAFFDNAKQRSTGLGEYLQSKGISQIYISGVATDYCVLYSTLDALELGFSTYVIRDACRGIDLHPGDVEKAFAEMEQKGAHLITSEEIECQFT